MSVFDFIQKHRQANSSLGQIAKDGLHEVEGKVNSQKPVAPTHLPSQKALVESLFDTDETVWLFFFDAGRYDLFDQLVWDYFGGDLRRCYNGGLGYTGDWAMRHLQCEFGNRGLFSWMPMRALKNVPYNGRKHFAVAPDIQTDLDTHEQLAALGYAQRQTSANINISPRKVNEAVRKHKADLNGGVIRYLKPHPPFTGLEEMTAENTKMIKTRRALEDGTLTYAELTQAYRETYKVAFEHAMKLIPDLDGKVIITADHGTCLTCGQLFHGRNHDPHDHLTHVPWFELDYIV